MRRLSSSGQLSTLLSSSPSPPPGATTPHESSAVVHQIEEWMRSDPHLAAAVGVVRALTEVIRTSPAATIMGLREELQAEVEKLKASMPGSVTIASGCELFMRFVTRTTLDALEDFSVSKARLVQRGEQFSRRLAQSRDKIAELALPFIRDGSVRCALPPPLPHPSSPMHCCMCHTFPPPPHFFSKYRWCWCTGSREW